MGGPFGGMIGDAVGDVLQGGSPFALIDNALGAIDGSGFGGLAERAGGRRSRFGGLLVPRRRPRWHGRAAILEGDVGALAQSALGGLADAAGGGGGGIFGSITDAVQDIAGGGAGSLLGELADFGAGSVFGAIPGGGSLLGGWEGILETVGGQLGDMSGGGLLGSVLGAAADGFDLGDLAPLVDQLEGGLGGFGLGGLSTQILEAATGGSFGAPDLGSFGSALEGLGVNVGSLSGVDELVTSLTGGTASQLVDQLSGSGSLDEFVGGLTPGGANALIDRVTDGGGGLDSLIGRLDGGGAQALLGKLAEAGNLEQTLGQLGPDGMADLITKMVAPARRSGRRCPGCVGHPDPGAGQRRRSRAGGRRRSGRCSRTRWPTPEWTRRSIRWRPRTRSTPRRLPTRTRCRTRRRRPSRSPRRPSRSRSTTPRPSRNFGDEFFE